MNDKETRLRAMIFKVRLAGEEIAKCNDVQANANDKDAEKQLEKRCAKAYNDYLLAEERIIGFFDGLRQ